MCFIAPKFYPLDKITYKHTKDVILFTLSTNINTIHTSTPSVRQNDSDRNKIIVKKYEGKRVCLLACFANGDFALVGLRLSRSFLGFTSSSLGQISLMPFSLRVSQVIPLIVVECQAKFTLITTKNEKPRNQNQKHNEQRERKRERVCVYLPRWLRIK